MEFLKKELMNKLKIILLSIAIGVIFSIIQILISINFSVNRLWHVDLLWQVELMWHLIHFAGYNAPILPLYEGTSVDFFVSIVGLLLGLTIYSIIAFIGISRLDKSKDTPKII